MSRLGSLLILLLSVLHRSRSIKSGYASFILAERFRTNTWTPVDEEARQLGIEGERLVGRRALADTIEATLGAAYSTGGLVMALETGDRLGLCFGGATPWAERSAARELSSRTSIVPPALQELQSNLGHTFRNGSLLLQAVTHRSYTAATTYCYERLEYLGDGELRSWVAWLVLIRSDHSPTRPVGDRPHLPAFPIVDSSSFDLPSLTPRLEPDPRVPRISPADPSHRSTLVASA